MRIISLLLIVVLALSLCPAAAKEPAPELLIDFNDNPLQDMALFKAADGTTLAVASGYDLNALAISAEGQYARAELALGGGFEDNIVISQTIRPYGNAAQLSVLSQGKTLLAVKITPTQVTALHKGGWKYLRGCSADAWYQVEVTLNLNKGKFSVAIDKISLSGMLSVVTPASGIDRLDYSARGTTGAKLLVDQIRVRNTQAVSKEAAPAGAAVSATDDTSTDTSYLGTFRHNYDNYQIPKKGVIPGEAVYGRASASSLGEGYTAEAAADGDPGTYWQAAPALEPVDNGKSLVLNKPNTTNATQMAVYTFAPQKGVVVIEQDIMVDDTTNEKAIPYVYDSSGTKMAATLLVMGGAILVAGTSLRYRDISADTWYNIKIEMNTGTYTSDFYINGVLWQKNVPFRAPCDDLGRIQYHMSKTSKGTIYVDNVRVYSYSPMQSFQTMLLEDDFEGYAKGAAGIPGWRLVHSDSGQVGIESYGLQSEFKFTQWVNIDVERESEFEGVRFAVPDGIRIKATADVSRKDGYYVTVQDFMDQYYGGEVFKSFSPVRARHLRLTIYDAVDESGNTVHARLSDLKVQLKHRKPVENVAFFAQSQVSGQGGAVYDKRGLTDNIIAEFGEIGEWRSGGEEEKWARLSWEKGQRVDRVVLYDGSSLTTHTKSGVLSFSDGSSLEVSDIPNSGMPKIIDFAPREITWVNFSITDYGGSNPGLSEFQVFLEGEKPALPEYVEPDEIITLNPDYASRWIAVSDIDNDGELEYITAKFLSEYGSHETVAVGVHKKDGSLLWTWGDPAAGSGNLGADVAMQVYDIDNDGTPEVFLCTRSHLIVLEGATGRELRRHPLPVSERYPGEWASDTIAFADISGNGYASDILVKTRYTDTWAYTKDWKLIWHVSMPLGMKVGHYPIPFDIDNDGRDEVITGYCAIDEDGSILWRMSSSQYRGSLSYGHIDAFQPVRFVLVGDLSGEYIINEKDLALLDDHLSGAITLEGDRFLAADTDGDGEITQKDRALLVQRLKGELRAFPNKGLPREQQRFCLSPCGAMNLIMIDGNGNRVWAQDDANHYESVEVGELGRGKGERQVVTNSMHSPDGNASYFIYDADGTLLEARFGYMRNRQLSLINWQGEGKPEYIYLPTDNVVVDAYFDVKVKPLSPYRSYDTLGMLSYQTGAKKYYCDIDGDGTNDIVNITEYDQTKHIYVYYNKNGAKVADAPGRGYNISQY